MADDQTRWVRQRFKGNKVWLATDGKGGLLEKNGKLLIKYQLNQPYEYWVHARSVKPLEETQGHRDNGSQKPETGRSAVRSGRRSHQGRSRPKPAVPKRVELENNAVHIFTDGASSGNPGPAGVGVVLRYGGRVKEISGYIGRTTNNVAELEAIRRGLETVKRRDLPVRLYTDSSYALGLLSQGWKARKNTALVNSIRSLMQSFQNLKLIKVKGHAGLKDNERADKLATSAIVKANSPGDGRQGSMV